MRLHDLMGIAFADRLGLTPLRFTAPPPDADQNLTNDAGALSGDTLMTDPAAGSGSGGPPAGAPSTDLLTST